MRGGIKAKPIAPLLLAVLLGLLLAVISIPSSAQQGGLSMDQVMKGAVQQKEIVRPESNSSSFPMSDGMIDVNAIPDRQPAPSSQESRPISQCSVVPVTVTDVYGLGAEVKHQCVCGLDQIVDMSYCR